MQNIMLFSMGYDASVYLVYGIPFSYGKDTDADLQWLLDLMLPDLIEKWGEEDVWSCFDLEPHTNGYYLLNFINDDKLFVSCWWMEHEVCRGRDGPKMVDMPSDFKKKRFLDWCTNNNIDTEEAGFYTVIGD